MLSSPYFIVLKFFTPPYDASIFGPFIVMAGGRAGGRAGAYLRFGTLDHVRPIFNRFVVLKGVWDGRGTILKLV